MFPNLQYQTPHVEQFDLDASNQTFYPQLQHQRRQKWSERDQRLQLQYNPIYTGYSPSPIIKDISGYSPSPIVKDKPHHPSAPLPQIQLQQDRLVQSQRNEDQLDSDRVEASENVEEVKNMKSEVEALRRQNQLLVNKYRQLHGAIEADI